ncbi:MAG: hypothetical protein KGI70_02445 [Patescibacteria group bacterium]|nr:hypothetical protein [Patescibacteria group bacterium]
MAEARKGTAMTLIGKAAYFSICNNCNPRHGWIICTDDSFVACYSKYAARVCAAELVKCGLMQHDELPVVLEQIDSSPLPRRHDYPAVFAPSKLSAGTGFYPPGLEVVVAEAYDDTAIDDADEVYAEECGGDGDGEFEESALPDPGIHRMQ